MRQKTKELSPTTGFLSYTTGKETSQTPKDSLKWGDGAESGETQVARVHRIENQKRESTTEVCKGSP